MPVRTVKPNANDTPANAIPKLGIPAAKTALPQPPNTSQKVPKNSANNFFMIYNFLMFLLVRLFGSAVNKIMPVFLSKIVPKC